MNFTHYQTENSATCIAEQIFQQLQSLPMGQLVERATRLSVELKAEDWDQLLQVATTRIHSHSAAASASAVLRHVGVLTAI